MEKKFAPAALSSPRATQAVTLAPDATAPSSPLLLPPPLELVTSTTVSLAGMLAAGLSLLLRGRGGRGSGGVVLMRGDGGGGSGPSFSGGGSQLMAVSVVWRLDLRAGSTTRRDGR